MQPLTTPVAKDALLSFGLVNLTVNVHTSVADIKDAPTHQACDNEAHGLTRVRQTLACPDCGNADKASFVRVREISKQLHLVHEEWLREQAAEAAKFKSAMPITMHPAEQVHAALIPNGKAYYVTVRPGSHPSVWEAYNTLVAMIAARPEVAFLTKLTFRTALQLFTLTTSDGMLMLNAMADSEMVRERPVIEAAPVSQKNLAIGMQVIDAALQDFDMAEHGSTGRKELADKIAAATPMTPAAGGEGLDVTAALTASIKKTKAPAKKAAAKKTTTARKAAVRKVS